MEEPRLSLRDRKSTESLSLITTAPVASWDQLPREPHLLDYLIILKKHQWLIVTFLLTVVTVVTIATFKTQTRIRGGRASRSGSGSADDAAISRRQRLRRVHGYG